MKLVRYESGSDRGRGGFRIALRMVSVLAGCIVVATLASCQTPSTQPPPAQTGKPSPPSTLPISPTPSMPSGDDQLEIRYDNGAGTVSVWTLTCDPVGGTHPDPEAACQALAGQGESALPAVAKDKVCTQQYGGPQTAVITGTWGGQPVDSKLSRINGCEIARWDALAGLLPGAGE